jgi:hypothetical protein
MKRQWLVLTLAAVVLSGGMAYAQEATDPAAASPAPAARTDGYAMADLVAAMPEETRNFVAIRDIADIALKVAAFSQRTGINLPTGDESIAQLIQLKTGAQGGVADRGAAGIVHLDPVKYAGRNALFMIPVQSREAYVEYNSAREVESGLYQMVGTDEPRFLTFHKKFALITDSIRTGRMIRDSKRDLADKLTDEQSRALAASDIYVHVDLSRSREASRKSAKRFRTAVSGKILGDPTLSSYSDLLHGYLKAVNELFAQVDGLDIGLTFRPNDVGVTLMVGFADGGSIAKTLATLGSSDRSLTAPLPVDRPLISSGGFHIDPEPLRDATLGIVDFFMQASPNTRKGVHPVTRDEVLRSVGDMMNELTGDVAFMSALPDPKSRAQEASVTVIGIKDMKAFADARGQFFNALIKVANESGARVRIEYMAQQEKYRDKVFIDHFKPRIAFTTKRYERLFEERAKEVYGPDGFLYRMAVLKDRVVMTVGSDLTLFHAAIDRALDETEPAAAPRIDTARAQLPKTRNVEYYFSLPAMLTRSVLAAGTAAGAARGAPVEFDSEDRQFLHDQGVVGLAVGVEGGRVRMDSNIGYDQLASAMAFVRKHLPPAVPPEPEPETPEPPSTTEEPESPAPETTPEPAPESATEPAAEPAETSPADGPDEAAPADEGGMTP